MYPVWSGKSIVLILYAPIYVVGYAVDFCKEEEGVEY